MGSRRFKPYERPQQKKNAGTEYGQSAINFILGKIDNWCNTDIKVDCPLYFGIRRGEPANVSIYVAKATSVLVKFRKEHCKRELIPDEYVYLEERPKLLAMINDNKMLAEMLASWIVDGGPERSEQESLAKELSSLTT